MAGDTNGAVDVFVHDRQTGQTTRVSVASDGVAGQRRQRRSQSERRRAVRGRSIVGASNLVAGDTNGAEDVFVHDRQTGQTTRVSVASDGAQGNGDSTYARLSADGRYVVFQSSASNLVPGDTNGVDDVFVHDRQTGRRCESAWRATAAQARTRPARATMDDRRSGPAISADGRWIVFPSGASNLRGIRYQRHRGPLRRRRHVQPDAPVRPGRIGSGRSGSHLDASWSDRRLWLRGSR